MGKVTVIVVGVNLAYAEEYARRGWDMVPVTIELNPHTGKKQVLFHNQWRKEASHDSDVIHEWFGDEGEKAHPYQGIAVATGKRSGLFVVDVDNEFYWETVVLAEEGHDLPETYTVKSQSGSTHYYFQWPEGFDGGGTMKLFDKKRDEWNEGKLGGIDVREEGGVIFAPPTFVYDSETHAVSGQYIVDTTKTTDVAELPKWILDIYLQNRVRKRGTSSTGSVVRRKVSEAEYPHTWDAKTAAKQLKQILDWAEEEFTRLAEDRFSYWDNGVTSVMGVLVRTVNAPWFEFTEADLDKFLNEKAPQDDGFGPTDWERIKNSCFRMADGDVIMYDETADEDFLMQLGAMFTVFGDEAKEEAELVTDQLAILPDEFWNARTVFSEIRTAAHAKMVSADASFHSFMASYCSQIPWQYQIDSGIGSPANFCYFTALVGPSGSGKGQAQSRGVNMANVEVDGQPSSGEGILEFFMGEEVDWDDKRNYDKSGDPVADPQYMKRVQVRHNILLSFAEGSALSQLSDRQNSILTQIILSLGVGEDLSTMTATMERQRHIDGGSYSCGLIASFQVKTSGLLLDQSEVGLTQRFIWSAIIDPSMSLDTVSPSDPVYLLPAPVSGPDPVMVTVEDSISKELRQERYGIVTGTIVIDPLDAHRPGKLLQIAGILRMLEGPNRPAGRYMITEDDWYLAKIIYDTSRKVRQQLKATVAAGRDEAIAEVGRQEGVRAVAREEATYTAKHISIRNKIFEIIPKLIEQGKSTKISYIKGSLTPGNRKIAETEVLPAMVMEGMLALGEDGQYTVVPQEEPEKAEPKKKVKK